MIEVPDEQLFSSRVKAFTGVYAGILSQFPGEKILVVSRYLRFLDILDEAFYRKVKIRALPFDSKADDNTRETIKNDFARSDDRRPLFMTPGAGGSGLNLATASHIIQCEAWWNGNDKNQAYARAYRQLQERTVHVWILQAVNSPIDIVITQVRNNKVVINNEIMGPLRRQDEDRPEIPYIY